MSNEKRERRIAAAPRDRVERAPRPGGRAAGQHPTAEDSTGLRNERPARTDRGVGRSRGTANLAGPSVAGARGARRHPVTDAPVAGTAALRLDSDVRIVADPAAASAPRLRVAPPAPIIVPRAPFVALIVLVVIAGVFGILMINTKTNENAFELARLQEQKQTLDNQQQDLERQITGHKDAGSLLAAARRLGLVDNGTPTYIRLPDGKEFGIPKPNDGTPAITSQQVPGR